MNPNQDELASLDRLHDIVVPLPASWWPLAPAWYAVLGLLLVFLVGISWVLIRQWRRNAYRRAALAEVEHLQSQIANPASLEFLAELVKRVALAAFPREQVASLTGAEWLRFLDASGSTKDFTQGAGSQLETAYVKSDNRASPELFKAVRRWIQQHRTDFR